MSDLLIELFAEILGVDPARLDDASSPSNVSAWDSVANISLITEIEARYEIELSTADIESMTDIGRARSVLERHGAAEHPASA